MLGGITVKYDTIICMGIPTFEAIMFPLLEYASDGKEHSLSEAIQHIEEDFDLSNEDKEKFLESGKQRVIANRVGWSRTFLKKAEFVEYTKRGYFKILPKGLEYLAKNPKQLKVKDLEKYPQFKKNWNINKKKNNTNESDNYKEDKRTPEEIIDDSFEQISDDLKVEIIEQIKSCSPRFFEKLVVDVLLAMGYGGSLKDAGKALGKTGDGGIDGIIKEDKLGLDIIYIQAKRWENTVGRPDIQKFAGALQGNRARKGVFITTSNFSSEALGYVQNIEAKIILIDGERLAQLMIDHNVSVSSFASYFIKRIDTDYFSED
ncbi:MAG: restriction endonuclease [Candidatus Peribacteraceae bacterium]|nr:restriction endonuclease [Candidatus Peribacteraceae bacterium]